MSDAVDAGMLDDLQGLVDEARELLDQQDTGFINDRFLIRQLNKGANLMTREAQLLMFPYQDVTVANQGEYPVKISMHDVYSVKYFDGTLLHTLEKGDKACVEQGARQAMNNPTHYYFLPYINRLSYQGSDNNISVSVLDNEDPQGEYRSVLGLYPIPDTAGRTFTIYCNLPHPRMIQMSDRCHIPEDFRDGVVAFALAKCLEKEKFFAESKYWYGVYREMSDKLCEYRAQSNIVGHPEVKVPRGESYHGWIPPDHRIIIT